MARTGMGTLISTLRQMTNAGTADSTIAGVTYFTDDQMQGYLDRYRQTHKSVQLSPIPERSGSSYIYKEYPLPQTFKWVEQNASESGWQLVDSAGSAAPAYTVNYDTNLVTFTNDTTGFDYYLDCRTYEMNRAAADVWGVKASIAAGIVDWRSDNHQISGSQEYEHCKAMETLYRGKSGAMVSRFVRSDEK